MFMKKVVSDQTKVKKILRELDWVNLFKNKPNILKKTEKFFLKIDLYFCYLLYISEYVPHPYNYVCIKLTKKVC